MLRSIAIVVAAVVLVAPALSAELGRAVLNGREIIVADDGTWAYAAPTKAGKGVACAPANRVTSAVVALSFCVDRRRWRAIDPGDEQEFTFLTSDGSGGMALTAERLPFGAAFLRSAILENAASAFGGSADEVEVVEEGTALLGGNEWNRMRYQVTSEDTVFQYLNYFRSADGFGSSQIVFWTVPSFAEELQPVFDAVTQSVVTPPAE